MRDKSSRIQSVVNSQVELLEQFGFRSWSFLDENRQDSGCGTVLVAPQGIVAFEVAYYWQFFQAHIWTPPPGRRGIVGGMHEDQVAVPIEVMVQWMTDGLEGKGAWPTDYLYKSNDEHQEASQSELIRRDNEMRSYFDLHLEEAVSLATSMFMRYFWAARVFFPNADDWERGVQMATLNCSRDFDNRFRGDYIQ